MNISPEETDARTVMTVYSIESLNKKCYTCAEILNPKFRTHLENSHCDEIVLSSEYSQMLLTNASSASGISHIISKLFNPEEETRLITTSFPEDFVNKTFRELRDYFIRLDGSILIGLLENSGNIFEYKREAIKEAQKTPDISKLIQNLKKVKNIKSNDPIINPGNNYIIKRHSKGILIEPSKLN
jgi:voltage-gated potassium channel